MMAYPTLKRLADELGPGAIFETRDGYWCQRMIQYNQPIYQLHWHTDKDGRPYSRLDYIEHRDLVFDRFLFPNSPDGAPRGMQGRFANWIAGDFVRLLIRDGASEQPVGVPEEYRQAAE